MGPASSTVPQRLSRRQLLQAGVAGAAGLALAACGSATRRAASVPPAGSDLGAVDHVVFLMLENRSFDHLFGSYRGVRGFDDTDNRAAFSQLWPGGSAPDGRLLPFHLDTATHDASCTWDLTHNWGPQHASWDHGSMDRFVATHTAATNEGQTHGPLTMGYYTRSDMPFLYGLADAFTICDAYHCSVLGPTWPNRLYWMTASIDPEGRYGGPVISNVEPRNGYRWKTYAERLEDAGVSWKVYQQKDNFGCNLLENFQIFQDAKKGSPLYEKGMVRGPVGQFEYDAMNDRLPAVSWIIPTSYESEHPDFMPAYGAAFIASKLDAIAANPDVWAKTVFILDYDENDGIFDHVVPPVPPPGTPGEFIDGLPIGAGFRVPCIVVSPWTTGGWVTSEPFDHTSVLQFLERFTGVREPNITDWRRRTFGDMTSVFRFNQADDQPPVLPGTRSELNLAKYTSTHLPRPQLPGAVQKMPKQEPGTRKKLPTDKA